MPFIHTKIPYHFDMTLHIAKRIWAMQKKNKKYPCPEAWEKKKKKDSTYLKIKDRVMQKRVRVLSRKNSTHMHILI